MKRAKLLRGCLILLALSAVLIYLNRQIEQAIEVVETVDKPQKIEKPKIKEPVVVPVQVVTQKPASIKKPEKAEEAAATKQQAGGSDGDQKNGGKDPAVLATYRLDVKSYLQFMLQQGAQAGLYDNMTGKFVCAINSQGEMGGIIRQRGMSARARRITSDFPNSQAILQMAAKQFGPAGYEILLLIPSSMDDRFYRNINKVIAESGQNPQDVSLVRVSYEGSQNSIQVKVNSLEGSGGTSKISGSFYL